MLRCIVYLLSCGAALRLHTGAPDPSARRHDVTSELVEHPARHRSTSELVKHRAQHHEPASTSEHNAVEADEDGKSRGSRRSSAEGFPDIDISHMPDLKDLIADEEDLIPKITGEEVATFNRILDTMKAEHVGQSIKPDASCVLAKSSAMTHIVQSGSAQNEYLQMMVTSAFTIIHNSNSPENIILHVAVEKEDAPKVAREFNMSQDCHIRKLGGAQVIVQYLSTKYMKQVMPHKVKHNRLATAQNFVRFGLNRFVPTDEGTIAAWVDADMYVLGDVVQAAVALKMSRKIASVVFRDFQFIPMGPQNNSKHKRHKSMDMRAGHESIEYEYAGGQLGGHHTHKIWPDKCHQLKKLPQVIRHGTYFQANIVFIKMDEWERRGFSSLIKKLVQCQNQGAWVSGSQVMMNMMVQYPKNGKDWEPTLLDLGRWNKIPKKGCAYPAVHAYHWTGTAKPFTKGAPCQWLWDKAYADLRKACEPEKKQLLGPLEPLYRTLKAVQDMIWR
eukprot:gnl/TRDRNA2_/TRDRNA2_186138_c0_seq1.p1 gnl/TRDRNA2_/TRDRNA2_186138_c0~~gnl/TRDRNA2_/TRDRNA2_186138_c0_seq1.p1  ORF type:complete len:501 (+),score=64.07 gnl/TRDRNA2_/TRDRNA2_186138_c0_seq1:62-1564(+)